MSRCHGCRVAPRIWKAPSPAQAGTTQTNLGCAPASNLAAGLSGRAPWHTASTDLAGGLLVAGGASESPGALLARRPKAYYIASLRLCVRLSTWGCISFKLRACAAAACLWVRASARAASADCHHCTRLSRLSPSLACLADPSPPRRDLTRRLVPQGPRPPDQRACPLATPAAARRHRDVAPAQHTTCWLQPECARPRGPLIGRAALCRHCAWHPGPNLAGPVPLVPRAVGHCQ